MGRKRGKRKRRRALYWGYAGYCSDSYYEDAAEQEAIRQEMLPVESVWLPQWALDAIGLADDARRKEQRIDDEEHKAWERRI